MISPWHHTTEYDQWQKEVIESCKNKCYLTEQNGEDVKLSTHHVFDASTYPEIVYDVANGVLMRTDLHEDFHIGFMGGYHVSVTKKDLDRYKRYLLKHKIIL